MEAFLLTALLALGAAALALPRWRLRRALAQPMDEAQRAILRRNVAAYGRMPAPLQAQLRRLVQQFLLQKKFIGCAGQEIDDEVRVTIAGYACLLLLNRPSRVYARLHAILVYPGEFLVPRNETDAAGVVTEMRTGHLGESWSDGRVVLSWDHVLQAARGAAVHNVVLHEFAHQLDSEAGATNGAPWLGDRRRYARWSEVFAREFAALRASAARGHATLIDPYGAANPAEFFAVATETFFMRPWQMADGHPRLFEELQRYYAVDPREWTAAPAPAPELDFAYGQWQ